MKKVLDKRRKQLLDKGRKTIKDRMPKWRRELMVYKGGKNRWKNRESV